MKMNECTSKTWTKVAEIPTDDFQSRELLRQSTRNLGNHS
jgi:hypothetical protein